MICWSSMMRRIKNTFIYYFARVAIALTGFVPARFAVPFGRVLGSLAHLVAGRERRQATDQLAAALELPSSGRRVRLLVRDVFRELGVSAIELCQLFRSGESSPQISVSADSRSALDAALAEGRGVVFVTGHIGNWELMALALARLGYPISTVAKESYDFRFTRLIESFRAREDVKAIYRGRPGSSAAMLRALKKNSVLGFLIDQDTTVPSAFVPFFGRPANTPIGAAVFALRSGAPVVVGTIHRTAEGKHIIDIARVQIPDNIEAATALLTSHLEQRIRRHPTQWVWFHRRWKTQPDGKTT